MKPYTDHQNRAWLQTEYSTAVVRAHRAADWKQFEAEKDVLPNLEWMPSTSPNPGVDHRVFWGTVLPIDHPFWNEHKPGDRWNCKCRLRNTDKEPTAVPTGRENDQPARGLENNPGKDAKLFSNKNAYFPSSCSSCPFAGNKLTALFANFAGKKNCYGCGEPKKIISNIKDSNDITAKLATLHTLTGASYNTTLKDICSMKVFKPMPGLKGVYWVGNSGDLDLENLKNAAIKAVRHGYRVFILPNPGNIRTADFILERKNLFKNYDLKSISGKNSVGNRLHESIGQTKRVLLNMNTDYNPRNLADEIKGYFETNKNALEVLIFKSQRSISIKREFALNYEFEKKFRLVWTKNK